MQRVFEIIRRINDLGYVRLISRCCRYFYFLYMKVCGRTYYLRHIAGPQDDLLVSRERFVPEAQPEVLYAKMHFERYEFATQFLTENDIVVDIACGSGYGSHIMAQKCSKVIGVDRSSKSINYAKQKYGIEGVVSDFFDFSGGGDIVVSFETIEHIDAPLKKTLLSLVSRANRIVVGSVPYMEVPNNPHHVHFFITQKHLLFLQKYGRLRIYYQEREPGSKIFDKFIENAQNIIFVLELNPK